MDPKTILNTLKEASPFDLFLVSFLLLPFVFGAWMVVLDKVEAGLTLKYWALGVILIAYILGVVTMLVGSTRTRSREIARDQILQYLTAKDFEMMSYDRVRSNINRAYSDAFLEELTAHFPNELRRAKLKGAKPGIARILESEAANEA